MTEGRTELPVRRATMNKTDLDDGVRANFLPLWRQRPLHRAALRPISRRIPPPSIPHWRQFFASSTMTPRQRPKQLRPVLERPGWPQPPTASSSPRSTATGRPTERAVGAKIAAQARKAKGPGVAVEEVRKATMDSVRALMMIRAYRMRGHLAADLDPLSSREPATAARARSRLLRLHRGRSRPADLHRQGPGPRAGDHPPDRRHPAAHLLLTLGVEFMHISDPEQKAWIQERIEGPDKDITFTAGRQERHPQQADRGGRLRAVPQCEIHRHQALRPRRRRMR